MATDCYSSPPCYAHELAPDGNAESPAMTAEELAAFLDDSLVKMLERAAPYGTRKTTSAASDCT